jgi:putative hemolysin
VTDILTNAALVLLFVLVGGVFSASEIALVSLRESQIQGLAQRGGRGLRVARLAANSNRFLSAVQVGVTLAGFFSASYGAATIAPRLTPVLVSWGVPEGAAGTIAFIGTTLVIAYLSLVLGELAPKRLALQRAEGLSLLVAAPLDVLASIMRPVIWLLSKSTDLVVRLLGGDPNAQREEMGEEELRSIVRGHQALTAEERRIVTEALEIGDRRVEQVMLPRTEVSFLRADTPVEDAVAECRDKPHSRYPVVADSLDDVLGFVHVRDLFDPLLHGRNVLVRDLVREVQLLPESVRVLTALTRMRATNTHLAIVVDEYGGTAGIVTLEDILEELVGEIEDEYDPRAVASANLPPGAVDVDGLLQVEDLHEHVPGVEIPDGPYETIGGFVMHRLGRMPVVGDTVSFDEHLITVSQVEGHRVARVVVTSPRSGVHPSE